MKKNPLCFTEKNLTDSLLIRQWKVVIKTGGGHSAGKFKNLEKVTLKIFSIFLFALTRG